MAHARHPVVITSLEEDFKAIGLIPLGRRLNEDELPPDEEEPEIPATESGRQPGTRQAPRSTPTRSARPATSAARPTGGGARRMGEADMPPPEAEEPPEHEDEPPAPPEDEMPPEAKEWFKGRIGRYLKQNAPPAGSATKPVKLPAQASQPKPAATAAAKQVSPKLPNAAAPAKESRNTRMRQVLGLTESRQPPRRTATRSASPQDRISSLLEEVNSLVGGIKKTGRMESIKAFANVALISDMLSRAFTHFGRELKEGDLYKAARTMNHLAERAGNMALALEQGQAAPGMAPIPPGQMSQQPEPPEPEQVTGAPNSEDDEPQDIAPAKLAPEAVHRTFRAQMGQLIDGLDLYADLTGDEMPTGEEGDEPPHAEPDADDLPPAGEGEEPPGFGGGEPPQPEDEEPPPEEEPPVGEARGSAMRRVKAGRQLKQGKSVSRAGRPGSATAPTMRGPTGR